MSQFDTLEAPERALAVDAAEAPESIAGEIGPRLNLSRNDGKPVATDC
ncbi:MAG: hypothetical protein ACREVK_06315 [Gammaproteobacteria bacterium]